MADDVADTIGREWQFQTLLIILYLSIPLCDNSISVTDNCVCILSFVI